MEDAAVVGDVEGSMVAVGVLLMDSCLEIGSAIGDVAD